jgi:hypothetical protein
LKKVTQMSAPAWKLAKSRVIPAKYAIFIVFPSKKTLPHGVSPREKETLL